MKRIGRNNAAIAMVVAWWLLYVAGPARAFQYGCAARNDERRGFPYTAAIEWRKAAEMFVANTRAAEYSWRQWERIMRLPRRLAGPIAIPQLRPCSIAPTSADSIMVLSDQISFAAEAA